MAHLIKLESGQLFNLDTMTHTTIWEDGVVAVVLVNGGHVELSAKDLEKIEKIAESSELNRYSIKDLSKGIIKPLDDYPPAPYPRY